jgi:endothelin-converting enzyme/putative endopeptidase
LLPVAEAAKLVPALGLAAYMAGVGTPPAAQINVVAPEFLRALDKVLRETPLADLKAYLHWNVLRDSAGLLPKRFDDESFSFYGRVLNGAREPQPQWRRCVNLVDQQLGDALGQLYVEKAFGAESRERIRGLVAALEAALEKNLRELPWMSEPARQEALAKLRAAGRRIGHPEKWIDYAGLTVGRNTALANYERASRFERDRDLAKIGRPAGRSAWTLTAPAANAYYDARENSIHFPAGILQPPFFDAAGDAALNFGAIGAVIAHELTHAYDGEGRQVDAQGNLRDWWTAADAAGFAARAACFEKQYAAYPATESEKVNARLTLGENVADNGGVRIALEALLASPEARRERIGGFTPVQLFFLGWARMWCENQTAETARLRQQVDPRAPGRYRVNGVLSNLPEFREAFGCRANQPMVNGAACRVW